ncbi:unannotated protein [freshwater metagenome]|uniref:Unannotated protein n=1 Tax=freshwater metagenome TaxID=449393 RepID=A0A6J6SUM8_9ZZZZ|nr:sugar dehydrogenase [Actinomycetota bacterium]
MRMSRAVLSVVLLCGGLGTTVPASAHEGHGGHAGGDRPASAGLSSTTASAPARAAEPGLPDRFRDETVIGGLTEPTAVDFAPDGTAFVAQKSGAISTYDRQADGTWADPSPGEFANLRSAVHNYYDRGLLGLAVDPTFPERPYVYVVYTWDRDPRDPGRVPGWGEPDGFYDECAEPAGSGPDGMSPGCVVQARVSRLTATPGPDGWSLAPGGEKPLVDAYCLQFPSHAAGSVQVGPDGYLYASVGEGASFDFADRGQVGNPCGDPQDEGGSMRSQDLLTSGDPVGLNGSVVRIDPDTGAPAPGNPVHPQGELASSAIAIGLRNPFRFTFRPGTGERPELWVGDVGGNGFEEVDRVVDASSVGPSARNFGWPCFEGPGRNPEFQALDLPVCERLYREGGVTAPYFSYETRGDSLSDDEGCASGTASISGVQFLGGTYPERYAGGLAFSDFSRRCVFVLLPGADGLPDPDRVEPLVTGALSPVDLTTGPEGDLYYVSYGTDERGFPLPGNGAIRRVHHYPGNLPPTARLEVLGEPYGDVPLEVSLDASGSRDEGSMTYAWDLDGDGVYDDAIGPRAGRTYTDGDTNVLVGVRVTDEDGATSTAQQWLYPGNTPPTLTIEKPTDTTTFAVGDQIDLVASGSDAEDGSYASRADKFSWTVSVRHCPSVCHTHPFTTFQYQNVVEGRFFAPDHEYKSTILLTASVIDDRNMTVFESIELQPRPSEVTLSSKPRGARLKATGHVGEGTYTYIENSRLTVSAPKRQRIRGKVWLFERWSDGGARTHEVVAAQGGVDLRAVYRAKKGKRKR